MELSYYSRQPKFLTYELCHTPTEELLRSYTNEGLQALRLSKMQYCMKQGYLYALKCQLSTESIEYEFGCKKFTGSEEWIPCDVEFDIGQISVQMS